MTVIVVSLDVDGYGVDDVVSNDDMEYLWCFFFSIANSSLVTAVPSLQPLFSHVQILVMSHHFMNKTINKQKLYVVYVIYAALTNASALRQK